MKKSLVAAALILGVVVSQLVVPSQAQAQEVYCYSETRGGQTTDTYYLTGSVQNTDYGIKIRLHTVGRYDSYNNYWEVGFAEKNGEWHWFRTERPEYREYMFPVADSPEMIKVLKIVRQYM